MISGKYKYLFLHDLAIRNIQF